MKTKNEQMPVQERKDVQQRDETGENQKSGAENHGRQAHDPTHKAEQSKMKDKSDGNCCG